MGIFISLLFVFSSFSELTIDDVFVPAAFADHAEASVSVPAGTSVPGCEEKNECYIPYEVTIDIGGEVTWSNDDSAAHTVTSGLPAEGSDGIFDSGLLMAGATFEYTFDEAGDYPYFCMVHPWKQGIVSVGAADDEATAMGMLSDGTEVEIWTTAPTAGERMEISIEFEGIEHVNYDIIVTQKCNVILDKIGTHHHDGKGIHETTLLTSSDPVYGTITFKGYGIVGPKTGPIGEEFRFSDRLDEEEDYFDVGDKWCLTPEEAKKQANERGLCMEDAPLCTPPEITMEEVRAMRSINLDNLWREINNLDDDDFFTPTELSTRYVESFEEFELSIATKEDAVFFEEITDLKRLAKNYAAINDSSNAKVDFESYLNKLNRETMTVTENKTDAMKAISSLKTFVGGLDATDFNVPDKIKENYKQKLENIRIHIYNDEIAEAMDEYKILRMTYDGEGMDDLIRPDAINKVLQRHDTATIALSTVVPEFGSITIMILIISVGTIIVLSNRAKLG